jgi:hypothetical protein
MSALAMCLLAGALFLFYRIYTNCGFEIGSNFALLSGLAVPLIALIIYTGLPVYKQAQRHLIPLADATLKSDTRAPIVFLRSFSQDPLMSGEEQKIRKALESFGPFVAIGSPKDELPPLGASRFYVGSEDWQSRVKSLLNKASLVIVLAGSTPGLAWEIVQVRASVDPQRLVIAVSNDANDYDNFRKTTEENTDIVLPEYPHQEIEKSFRVSGLIRLDNGWVGTFQSRQKDCEWRARHVFDTTTKETFIILEMIRNITGSRDIGMVFDSLTSVIILILVLVVMVGEIATSCRGQGPRQGVPIGESFASQSG